ncbi:HET-domain-containing protein, partial [Ophiobolus disseminans]
MKRLLDYRKRRALAKSSSNSNIAASFKYQKLHGKGAIRLLTIQPGTEADQIVCQLQHNVLLPTLKNTGTTYDALSYRWGEQSPLSAITLDGQEFHVGPNLHGALKIMRRPDQPRVVWIDAICINQGKDSAACAERAIQVKMMQDIYGSATQTVIWLGAEADESNMA